MNRIMIFDKRDKSLNLWVKIGISALAIAGIYSIILVFLRAPQLSQFFEDKSFFRTALVVHVNLSVLVWLLSGVAIIWSMHSFKTQLEILFSRMALFGMIMMATGPFIGESKPVMNNYIPMLENLVFIIGLSLFGVSLLLFALQVFFASLLSLKSSARADNLLIITIATSSLMFILLWVCFALTYCGLSQLIQYASLDIDFYYEMLFWSGGHLLQFIYTQILMFIWVILLKSLLKEELKFSWIYNLILILNFIIGLGVFYGHAKYDITDGYFKEFYTLHMKHGGGIAPTLFLISIFAECLKNKFLSSPPKFSVAAFVSSILLFFYGGAVGLYISGVNVTIPAHYHGMIVGISVAMMGFVYLYSFETSGILAFNDRKPAWQIYIFTFGQMIHIIGLAMAGGYGIMRKTPGVEMPVMAKIYMGMVGFGGLIAIMSGLIFVYICAKKLFRKL